MTPAEFEPVTFRFVAQHLNHCATAVPSCMVLIPKADYTIIQKKVILLQGAYLEQILNTVGPRLDHGPMYCDVYKRIFYFKQQPINSIINYSHTTTIAS